MYGRSYTVACILSTGIPVDVRNIVSWYILYVTTYIHSIYVVVRPFRIVPNYFKQL